MGLGVPAPMAAGAIISGAIIGDKLSPLSDSTNLAAGVCEANLFKHIKSMLFTTVPAFVIALIIYLILGFRYNADTIDTTMVNVILNGINDNFNVSPGIALLSMIPLAAVLIMAFKQVSALAAMVVASLIGMILAMVVNGYNIYEMMSFMNYGFTIDTGIFEVDKSSIAWYPGHDVDGIPGYLGLSYGGIREKTGTLDALIGKMMVLTKNARNLIITHILARLPSICFLPASMSLS
jgi:NhaC family Na+:H+ antiporter